MRHVSCNAIARAVIAMSLVEAMAAITLTAAVANVTAVLGTVYLG